jgi:hypothetical protein
MNILENLDKNYSKSCPSCNSPIYYTRRETLKDSLEKNRLCRNCFLDSIRRKEISVFKRNCPKCNKEIFYNEKWAMDQAFKKNSLCKSCSKKGIPHPYFYNNLSEKSKLGMSKTWFKCGERPHNADFRKGKNIFEIYGDKAKNIIEKYHQRKQSKEANIKRSIACKKAGCGSSNKGKKCSDENRKKFRIRMIDLLKKTNKKFHPGYNEQACLYFDRLMEQTGTKIQHALNGGEYFLDKLGYWVDGYDKENNTVYEFDERRHYDVYGNLKEKDRIKQKEIIEFLNCKFIRIKWNEV